MMRDAPADALGVQHPPAEDDARIVSLVPSITELLFHLGLGEQVVGRTSYCIHPGDALARVPRVGGTKKPRIDKLRELRPSHVIVNVDENRKQDVEVIAEFTPHIIVTHPLVPDDNLALYRLLGGIFGKQGAARRLCGEFQRARDALVDAAATLPPQRVLYLIWRDPWMTISRDTYISRMLALANWKTTSHDPESRYPEVRPDGRLLADTDIVLFSSEPFPFKPAHVDELRGLTGDTGTPCEFIDGEMTSWYGSRAVEGLRYLRDFASRFA
ncbi:MAG: helical backbone metal receptor [Gammaproteobacteria bacterium]|nr:MAG: helical backbone metal receptor [Gammaproteobacteria bacterium]